MTAALGSSRRSASHVRQVEKIGGEARRVWAERSDASQAAASNRSPLVEHRERGQLGDDVGHKLASDPHLGGRGRGGPDGESSCGEAAGHGSGR